MHAVPLFTSATSVLIFIGILTSRYAEKEFQRMLPWKLLSGLFFLFLSVVFMVVAFCAALAIVVNKYWAYNDSFMYEILLSTISNPIPHIKKKRNNIQMYMHGLKDVFFFFYQSFTCEDHFFETLKCGFVRNIPLGKKISKLCCTVQALGPK